MHTGPWAVLRSSTSLSTSAPRRATKSAPRTHQQHLHWQQVDQNHPLVLLAGAMAVLKGKRQVLLSCREQALISDPSTQPSMLTPAHSTTTLVQKAGQPHLISVPVTFLKSNPQPQIH